MELKKGLCGGWNANGVYVKAPDWYILDGTNKMALGYREGNFALSREQQKILNRQNIYDGLWDKIPSMCWGFVPLTEYHGGGAEAPVEPLTRQLHNHHQRDMPYYCAGRPRRYHRPPLYH